MCTAILSIQPGAPVLLAGIRDELADRAWLPPRRHWPDYPGLIGGLDVVAGGTWLALAPDVPRVACVLNGSGRMAPVQSRQSRGVLPLQAAASGKLLAAGLADFDPFHLLIAELGTAVLWSWDGVHLTERDLAAGSYFMVNGGLGSDTTSAHEQARVAHFWPRLRAVPRPAARPGSPVRQAWGGWLPLLEGDGIEPDDPRALIVRRDLGDGRTWGTTSVSLVSLATGGSRYDFTAAPGDPAAWYPVPLSGEAG
jgi:hypothetical protein